ncbi:MAG TPA: cation:proton antiporter [Acidimicrobiia bacterium]|jgi:Kef-type K+ transport system membrane component KefB
MPDISFNGLLAVAIIAVTAPLLVNLAPALRLPAVVLEIVAGIVVGPSGLGWVELDLPIQVLGLIGLAFLLFLAGLEIDVAGLRGPRLRKTGLGYLLTLAIGIPLGLAFSAAGWVDSPLLLAITLSATSLGLVVPVLKDARQADGEVGQLTIAAASIADFAAILLLTIFFSQSSTGTGTKLLLIGGFALLALVATLALSRAGMSMGLDTLLTRLQDTTAEIRVRIAVLLLVAFVALAEHLGLEAILGAFLAGAILNLVDRDTATHPHFRLKLEAIGYGFLVPVFFVGSGLRFDLDALLDSPSALARVPLFLAALLVARGVPALLYAPSVGRRPAVAAALLQATSLPFIVTASQIGLLLGEFSAATAAGLIAAGLLSVVVFPPVALALLRDDATRPAADAPLASSPAT